jgi:hypothetical protein
MNKSTLSGIINTLETIKNMLDLLIKEMKVYIRKLRS